MRLRRGSAVLTVAAASGLAAATAGATAARVIRVGTPPKTVAVGAKLRLTVQARPASAKLSVYLSRDRRRDRRDIALGTARLRKGRIAVAVPARVTPATYHVLVCAQRRCAVSARRVRVAPDVLAGLPSLSAAPSPVTVHPIPGPVLAAGRFIGAEGGDLTAVGADGSTYTLSIPAGALTRVEPVVVAPLGSIGGLPFTTAAPAAVALRPDGLRLLAPATLTIVPAHPTPLRQQVGFAWHGLGTDFHITPVGADPAKLTMTLWRFSGAGVGGATPQERATQQRHLPQTPEDRLDQQLAEALDATRRDDATASPKARAHLFVRAFDDVVLPAVKTASHDETRLADAMTPLTSWTRTTEVITDRDKAAPEVKKRFDRAVPRFSALLDATYAKAKQRCEAGDPSQVVRLQQVARLQAILGLTAAPAGADVAHCTTFTFTLDDHITDTEHGATMDADWRIDALPLGPDAEGKIRATTTLHDGGWSISQPWAPGSDCTTSNFGSNPGGPVTVAVQLDPNRRDQTDAQGISHDVVGPAQITIGLSGDLRPENTFSINCMGSDPEATNAVGLWAMAWMSRPSSESYWGTSRSSPIVDATRTGHRIVADTVIDDTLRIRLDHTAS